MSRIVAILFVSASVVFCSNSAFAETSGWLSGGDALRLTRLLVAENMIVTDLKCKDSGSRGFGVQSASVQLTYKQNVNKTVWVAGGWTSLNANRKYWERKGYHLVKYSMFVRRKSGQPVYCTLYYK